MSGIIVYCLITYNASSFGMSFVTEGFTARSIGACYQESHKRKGLTGFTREFDLSKERDKKDFEIKCGPNGVDCPYIKAEKE